MTTVEDDLTATRKAVVELERRVGRLSARYGDTLGMRRLVSDVRRFEADLAELGPPPASTAAASRDTDLLTIEDSEYDPAFWEGVDSEGLGAADRHAP